MENHKTYSNPIQVVLISLILGLCFISTVGYAREVYGPVVNPLTFQGKDTRVYMSSASGTSYGWKILCIFRVSRPGYEAAINKLWKNAGIPNSDKRKYRLVNIRESTGTDWGVILFGQNYLTVNADIIYNDTAKKHLS